MEILEAIWEIVIKTAWYWLFTIIPTILAIVGAYEDTLPSDKRSGVMMQIYNMISPVAWMILGMTAFVVTIFIGLFIYLNKHKEKSSQPTYSPQSIDQRGGNFVPIGKNFGTVIVGAPPLEKKLLEQPKIVLTPTQERELIPTSGVVRIHRRAILIVENKEEQPITECYARIIFSEHLQGTRMIKDNLRERLKWIEEKECKNLCEIEIPRTDLKHVDVGYGDDIFRYSFCSNDGKKNILGSWLYSMKIRIDGKFNGANINPKIFNGYAFVYQEHFYKTDAGKTVEEYSPMMIFREGDWRKDKEVEKLLERMGLSSGN